MSISPMMQHYIQMKEKHKDSILFYRLGDFYEMFFDDAVLCSKELDLTLTGKDCGLDSRAPMCGIPYHASEQYIAKLIARGYRVAICEQLTQPNGRDLVERDVIRIMTPGTVVESSILDETKNNYIASIFYTKQKIAIAWSDISTGILKLAEFSGETNKRNLDSVLSRVTPSEVIVNDGGMKIQDDLSSVVSGAVPRFYAFDDSNFKPEVCQKYLKIQFTKDEVINLVKNNPVGCSAIGALLAYLTNTQKKVMSNITHVEIERPLDFMQIDSNTRKNLELLTNINHSGKKGTLLWVLDKTKTSMGSRCIKNFISEPLNSEQEINARIDFVEELFTNETVRDNLTEILSKMNDIERIAGRIAYGTISPKDALSLSATLEYLPRLKREVSLLKSSYAKTCFSQLHDLTSLTQKINSAIDPNAPALLKDGNVIRTGYSKELDELRNAKKLSSDWLLNYEQSEKEKTGIKNLKIGFNKIFGYYIEVTNSMLSLVPFDYIRKQTTTTGERYITEELKNMEEKILGSTEMALKLEFQIYSELKTEMLNYVTPICEISNAIGKIDTIRSFAQVSRENNYTKPIISKSINSIKISNGRHPVVEQLLHSGDFVPNDTILDSTENRTMLITGPNMAGKSTYLRQVAIITLMAHMGCFVPASSAEISITDQIFTRIGASDDLVFGQSTFMVEMMEVANILQNATDRSLLILDEVGRGTSTFDGLSIAWAVMEYLSQKMKAKTLFATHFHELTTLEGKTLGIKNYRVMVKELADTVVFLHKIARGSANRSFGLEVAKMAGIPKEVLTRANEILIQEESKASNTDISMTEQSQKSFSSPTTVEIVNILKDTNMNNITPLVAFGTLQNLVDKAKTLK